MAKTKSEMKNAYAKKAYDDLRIQVKKGEKDKIREHATEQGESINGFVNRAIRETMDRDIQN